MNLASQVGVVNLTPPVAVSYLTPSAGSRPKCWFTSWCGESGPGTSWCDETGLRKLRKREIRGQTKCQRTKLGNHKHFSALSQQKTNRKSAFSMICSGGMRSKGKHFLSLFGDGILRHKRTGSGFAWMLFATCSQKRPKTTQALLRT